MRTPSVRGRRAPVAGLRELSVFALAYLVYFGVRVLTEGSVADAVANAFSLIDLERKLGIAWEGTMQEAMLRSGMLVLCRAAGYAESARGGPRLGCSAGWRC